MKLKCFEFEDGENIPKKYTCDGENINPQLIISEVPENAKSLALIIDDPDALSKTWVHWIVFNMPPDIKEIQENSIPKGFQGINDFRRLNYGGPCPPSGKHRYFFKLYALDKMLDLKEGAIKKELENAIKGHIIEKAIIIGIYSRE